MPATLTQVSVTPLPNAVVSGFGPTSVLQSNPYQMTQLQYPLDELGTPDVPHYMTFNINIPTASKYASNSSVSGNSTSKTINGQYQASTSSTGSLTPTGAAITAVTAGISGGSLSAGVSAVVGSGAAIGAASGTLSITPSTTRIGTSISLYMPDTFVTEYGQQWNSISLTAALGTLGKMSAAGGTDVLKELETKGAAVSDMTKNAIKSGQLPSVQNLLKLLKFNNTNLTELEANIAEQTGVVGSNFADLVLRSQNKALNPKNEMLFQGTLNRSFVFEFDFQPRSQKEAYQIYQIIRAFKAFAAPEYSNAAAGRYMIPPATFDIGFFYMNAENLALPRISSCALTNISVNYVGSAPFTTFNDGFPVHTHMALTFTEIDIITRELIQTYGF